MNPLNRFLLAISVVALLVPVAGVALPNGFDGILPWSGSAPAPSSLALAAEDRAEQRPQGQEETGRSVNDLTCAPPQCEFAEEEHHSAHVTEAVSNDIDTSTNSTDSDPDSTTDDKTSANESEQDNTPTTGSTPTTKATTTSTTDDGSETVKADGTITGDACPCTVTGTVELKGEVNLQGDIMVKGGTLVARSGVTVNGNRFQIMFMGGGKADFRGSKVSTWSGNGDNANLSRDVQFRNLRRIMFHDTAPSTLSYVSVIDSGTTGVSDDYPLHWHFSADSSRGTVVEGVVVLNGKNHAYVPHASHGITFRNVIAKNTFQEPFWWNTTRMDPCASDSRGKCRLNDSHDITIDRALVDGVDGSNNKITGFMMGQGDNNSLTNSATKNIGSSGACAGYLWNTDTPFGDWFFSNNTALSGPCDRAIYSWQNREDGEVIQNFKSELFIEHGAYRNRHEYRNIDVPLFIAHAMSFTVRDSTIGHVIVEDHSTTGGIHFINVTLERVSIWDVKGEPGTYVFDPTNITCADVDLGRAHSGSEVIVNGVDCMEG